MVLAMRHGVLGYEAMDLNRLLINFPFGVFNYAATRPFLAQEFCARNSGDIRVVVAGNKVFGFARANRPDDFRASGSGRIEYIDDLPQACVETAHRISRECGFVCMAYDFILNNQDQWVVAEISYTFVSEPPARCQYFYDAEQGLCKKRQAVGSVERLILEQIMAAGD